MFSKQVMSNCSMDRYVILIPRRQHNQIMCIITAKKFIKQDGIEIKNFSILHTWLLIMIHDHDKAP